MSGRAARLLQELDRLECIGLAPLTTKDSLAQARSPRQELRASHAPFTCAFDSQRVGHGYDFGSHWQR
jgi:hypothetical protein